jgi:hypothetical protein
MLVLVRQDGYGNRLNEVVGREGEEDGTGEHGELREALGRVDDDSVGGHDVRGLAYGSGVKSGWVADALTSRTPAVAAIRRSVPAGRTILVSSVEMPSTAASSLRRSTRPRGLRSR